MLLFWSVERGYISLSEAFNINTEHPLRFNSKPDDFFGYSVYQTDFGNRKQIIVGAPLQGNSTGKVYSCTADLQSCKQLQRPDSESICFFGMFAAVSSAAVTVSSVTLICHEEFPGTIPL
ncbi:hypothetical protein QQF64_023798 [Cirrhinus molitorella]|uniref:Uncharacterized protein n=1 Tax=Cirrhinus molitorella TaxID=172907 RepID=A0ABR3NJE0_9TELE